MNKNAQRECRAPLKTLLWSLTCSLFQLLRCRNTHLAQLNSVFSASYLKKITSLSFQTELLEMPININVTKGHKFEQSDGSFEVVHDTLNRTWKHLDFLQVNPST